MFIALKESERERVYTSNFKPKKLFFYSLNIVKQIINKRRGCKILIKQA